MSFNEAQLGAWQLAITLIEEDDNNEKNNKKFILIVLGWELVHVKTDCVQCRWEIMGLSRGKIHQVPDSCHQTRRDILHLVPMVLCSSE